MFSLEKKYSGIDDITYINNDCRIDPSIGGGEEPKES
jgi:hypothetical protein